MRGAGEEWLEGGRERNPLGCTHCRSTTVRYLLYSVFEAHFISLKNHRHWSVQRNEVFSSAVQHYVISFTINLVYFKFLVKKIYIYIYIIKIHCSYIELHRMQWTAALKNLRISISKRSVGVWLIFFCRNVKWHWQEKLRTKLFYDTTYLINTFNRYCFWSIICLF